MHQVPGLYGHNEAWRSALVAKALQNSRVLAALPQTSDTDAADAISAAGGANMPARPELYCTAQLDHITQQQSTSFETQCNAMRLAITEIDTYDNPVGSYSREWQRFCDWDAASGNSLVTSRTKLNEAIPHFSLILPRSLVTRNEQRLNRPLGQALPQRQAVVDCPHCPLF